MKVMLAGSRSGSWQTRIKETFSDEWITFIEPEDDNSILETPADLVIVGFDCHSPHLLLLARLIRSGKQALAWLSPWYLHKDDLKFICDRYDIFWSEDIGKIIAKLKQRIRRTN